MIESYESRWAKLGGFEGNLDDVKKLFKIRDKRRQVVQYAPNPAQALWRSKRTRRNLIVKARQKGLSKEIDADQLAECLIRPTNAVVVSHEKEATKRLFAAVRFYVETMAVPPATRIDSRSELTFPKRGSSYWIGTAGQRAFGRGDTIHRAHLSEAAYYSDFERIVTGISEAAEYGQIDIETTPNGREAVYDLWQKAKAGRSSFTNIFVPWYIDDEYSADSMLQREKDGLSASVQEMFAIPDAQFEWAPDERELAGRVLKEYGIILTVGQIKWRRYKIWDRGELFWQEYPEDDVSCFLQSGRSVFSRIITRPELRVPLDDFDRWDGPADEKARLAKDLLYGGVDGAEGVQGGDSHSFAVADIVPGKEHGTFIYEYTANEPLDVFWSKVAPIARRFNIVLGIEKNGVGLAHCREARRLGVPFREWETTATTRPVMVSELEGAYRKTEMIETYPEAEDEARNMRYGTSNRPEHPPGKHDDRVFSRAIAYQMSRVPKPSVEWI